ncbi:MAG: hypothetical protein ACJ0QO_01990 [Parvicellaceae bacterium]
MSKTNPHHQYRCLMPERKEIVKDRAWLRGIVGVVGFFVDVTWFTLLLLALP